jgi:TorA maturation chaperone TorD
MQTAINTAHDSAVLLARRVCYRFVGLALADPQTGVWEELADRETHVLVSQAAAILREEQAAVARPLAKGERPLADLDPAAALARLPSSAAELNGEYEATFGLLGGSKCPPYETEYVPNKFVFQRSNMLADIAGFYRAFGLQPSTTNPDRPDHAAVECEFLAQLIGLQWQARRGNTAEAESHADICQAALERFLREHVVWWQPAFAAILARQNPGGFYEGIAHFLAALIGAERAMAGIECLHQPAEISPIESLDECSGCELANR